MRRRHAYHNPRTSKKLGWHTCPQDHYIADFRTRELRSRSRRRPRRAARGEQADVGRLLRQADSRLVGVSSRQWSSLQRRRRTAWRSGAM